MALTRTPRSRWIDEGLRVHAAGGPDAVRMEAPARALGVAEGGFYWNFDDRRALLAEMLDTVAGAPEIGQCLRRRARKVRTKRHGFLSIRFPLYAGFLMISRHES